MSEPGKENDVASIDSYSNKELSKENNGNDSCIVSYSDDHSCANPISEVPCGGQLHTVHAQVCIITL